MPFDGTAFDGQGIADAAISGAPQNLAITYIGDGMSDDSTWDEFTAAGYGPAELMALTIQGSLAAGSTMTITLPINISALAGAPTDGSETIQTAGLDLEASPTFFGARGSSLVLSSWDIALTAPAAPTQSGNTVTIPTEPNVIYQVDGVPVTGPIVLADGESVTIEAVGAPGYTLGETNPSWDFSYAAPVPETPTPEVPSTESPADSIDGVTVNTGGSESNGLVGLGAALALIGAVTAAGIRRKQS